MGETNLLQLPMWITHGELKENLYIYNTCALSKHMGNMCMRLRNAGKGEASPSFFPRFAPNTHIYPAMTAFTDQYSLPNIFFDIGQL